MAAGIPNFIGFGILTPFRRGPADFVAGGNLEILQSMISQVLGTKSGSDFTQGELAWRDDFGSLLRLLKNQNNDLVRAELARVYVVDALARWIPQIRIKDVEISRQVGPQGEENILAIRMVYDVIGINRPGNVVLLPDVVQVVLLAA